MASMGMGLARYGGIGAIVVFCLLGTLLHTIDKETPASMREASSVPAWPSLAEDLFLDWRMDLRGGRAPRAGAAKVAVLRIDDDSLGRIGRWPWSRLLWARVLDRLAHFGARVAAFDVFFP